MLRPCQGFLALQLVLLRLHTNSSSFFSEKFGAPCVMNRARVFVGRLLTPLGLEASSTLAPEVHLSLNHFVTHRAVDERRTASTAASRHHTAAGPLLEALTRCWKSI